MTRTCSGPRRTSSRSIAKALALALVCGGAASLTGCSGESDAQAAVRQARHRVHALNSGSAPASPSHRLEVYRDLQTRLNAAVGELEGSEAAAALTLLGEAQTGIAEISAAEAATLDNQLLSLVAQARSAASLFHSQSSLAAAMESYDPAKTLEELRDSGRDFQADLVAVQASRDALQQRLDELTTAAGARASEGGTLRLEAAQLRRDAMEQDPASRAEAAQRSFEVARRADALDREAAELNAAAAVVRPQLATADIDILRWNRQIELAALARTNLQAAVDARLAQAGVARAAADEAAARFDQLAQQIEALRAGESATAYDAATSAYTSGIATLRRASQAVTRPDAKGPQALALAQAQSALADVQRSRARTLGVVADLFTVVAEMSPALPNASNYRELAASILAKSDELLAAASEQYTNAQASLASSGLRGDLRERVDRVGASLTEASARMSGEPLPAPETAPTPEGEPMPEGASETPAPEPSNSPEPGDPPAA